MQTITWTDSNQAIARQRVLVIHGMEFHSKEEVVHDLVNPLRSILSQTKSGPGSQDAECDLGYFHWDSRIDPITGRKMFPLTSFIGNAVRMGRRLWEPDRFLSSLESRAMSAGRCLATQLARILEEDRDSRLIVVSHSLGSLVFAEAMRQMILDGSRTSGLGRWLNLQPAVSLDQFQRGGRFAAVDRVLGRTQTVFHSQFDCVLRCLFTPLAGRPALGQVGPMGLSASRADVSRVAWEAHGQTALFPRMGCFFRRSRHMMANYFKEVRYG